jgi:hypothetical protein
MSKDKIHEIATKEVSLPPANANSEGQKLPFIDGVELDVSHWSVLPLWKRKAKIAFIRETPSHIDEYNRLINLRNNVLPTEGYAIDNNTTNIDKEIKALRQAIRSKMNAHGMEVANLKVIMATLLKEYLQKVQEKKRSTATEQKTNAKRVQSQKPENASETEETALNLKLLNVLTKTIYNELDDFIDMHRQHYKNFRGNLFDRFFRAILPPWPIKHRKAHKEFLRTYDLFIQEKAVEIENDKRQYVDGIFKIIAGKEKNAQSDEQTQDDSFKKAFEFVCKNGQFTNITTTISGLHRLKHYLYTKRSKIERVLKNRLASEINAALASYYTAFIEGITDDDEKGALTTYYLEYKKTAEKSRDSFKRFVEKKIKKAKKLNEAKQSNFIARTFSRVATLFTKNSGITQADAAKKVIDSWEKKEITLPILAGDFAYVRKYSQMAIKEKQPHCIRTTFLTHLTNGDAVQKIHFDNAMTDYNDWKKKNQKKNNLTAKQPLLLGSPSSEQQLDNIIFRNDKAATPRKKGLRASIKKLANKLLRRGQKTEKEQFIAFFEEKLAEIAKKSNKTSHDRAYSNYIKQLLQEVKEPFRGYKARLNETNADAKNRLIDLIFHATDDGKNHQNVVNQINLIEELDDKIIKAVFSCNAQTIRKGLTWIKALVSGDRLVGTTPVNRQQLQNNEDNFYAVITQSDLTNANQTDLIRMIIKKYTRYHLQNDMKKSPENYMEKNLQTKEVTFYTNLLTEKDRKPAGGKASQANIYFYQILMQDKDKSNAGRELSPDKKAANFPINQKTLLQQQAIISQHTGNNNLKRGWVDESKKTHLGHVGKYIADYNGQNSRYASIMTIIATKKQINTYAEKMLELIFDPTAKHGPKTNFCLPAEMTSYRTFFDDNKAILKNTVEKIIDTYIKAKKPWKTGTQDVIDYFDSTKNKDDYRLKRLFEIITLTTTNNQEASDAFKAFKAVHINNKNNQTYILALAPRTKLATTIKNFLDLKQINADITHQQDLKPDFFPWKSMKTIDKMLVELVYQTNTRAEDTLNRTIYNNLNTLRFGVFKYFLSLKNRDDTNNALELKNQQIDDFYQYVTALKTFPGIFATKNAFLQQYNEHVTNFLSDNKYDQAAERLLVTFDPNGSWADGIRLIRSQELLKLTSSVSEVEAFIKNIMEVEIGCNTFPCTKEGKKAFVEQLTNFIGQKKYAEHVEKLALTFGWDKQIDAIRLLKIRDLLNAYDIKKTQAYITEIQRSGVSFPKTNLGKRQLEALFLKELERPGINGAKVYHWTRNTDLLVETYGSDKSQELVNLAHISYLIESRQTDLTVEFIKKIKANGSRQTNALIKTPEYKTKLIHRLDDCVTTFYWSSNLYRIIEHFEPASNKEALFHLYKSKRLSQLLTDTTVDIGSDDYASENDDYKFDEYTLYHSLATGNTKTAHFNTLKNQFIGEEHLPKLRRDIESFVTAFEKDEEKLSQTSAFNLAMILISGLFCKSTTGQLKLWAKWKTIIKNYAYAKDLDLAKKSIQLQIDKNALSPLYVDYNFTFDTVDASREAKKPDNTLKKHRALLGIMENAFLRFMKTLVDTSFKQERLASLEKQISEISKQDKFEEKQIVLEKIEDILLEAFDLPLPEFIAFSDAIKKDKASGKRIFLSLKADGFEPLLDKKPEVLFFLAHTYGKKIGTRRSCVENYLRATTLDLAKTAATNLIKESLLSYNKYTIDAIDNNYPDEATNAEESFSSTNYIDQKFENKIEKITNADPRALTEKGLREGVNQLYTTILPILGFDNFNLRSNIQHLTKAQLINLFTRFSDRKTGTIIDAIHSFYAALFQIQLRGIQEKRKKQLSSLSPEERFNTLLGSYKNERTTQYYNENKNLVNKELNKLEKYLNIPGEQVTLYDTNNAQDTIRVLLKRALSSANLRIKMKSCLGELKACGTINAISLTLTKLGNQAEIDFYSTVASSKKANQEAIEKYGLMFANFIKSTLGVSPYDTEQDAIKQVETIQENLGGINSRYPLLCKSAIEVLQGKILLIDCKPEKFKYFPVGLDTSRKDTLIALLNRAQSRVSQAVDSYKCHVLLKNKLEAMEKYLSTGEDKYYSNLLAITKNIETQQEALETTANQQLEACKTINGQDKRIDSKTVTLLKKSLDSLEQLGAEALEGLELNCQKTAEKFYSSATRLHQITTSPDSDLQLLKNASAFIFAFDITENKALSKKTAALLKIKQLDSQKLGLLEIGDTYFEIIANINDPDCRSISTQASKMLSATEQNLRNNYPKKSSNNDTKTFQQSLIAMLSNLSNKITKNGIKSSAEFETQLYKFYRDFAFSQLPPYISNLNTPTGKRPDADVLRKKIRKNNQHFVRTIKEGLDTIYLKLTTTHTGLLSRTTLSYIKALYGETSREYSALDPLLTVGEQANSEIGIKIQQSLTAAVDGNPWQQQSFVPVLTKWIKTQSKLSKLTDSFELQGALSGSNCNTKKELIDKYISNITSSGALINKHCRTANKKYIALTQKLSELTTKSLSNGSLELLDLLSLNNNERHKYIPANKLEYRAFIILLNKHLFLTAETSHCAPDKIANAIVDVFKKRFPHERYKNLARHLTSQRAQPSVQTISAYFPNPRTEKNAYTAFIALLNKDYLPTKAAISHTNTKTIATDILSEFHIKSAEQTYISLILALHRACKQAKRQNKTLAVQTVNNIIERFMPKNNPFQRNHVINLFNHHKLTKKALSKKDKNQKIAEKITKDIGNFSKNIIALHAQATSKYEALIKFFGPLSRSDIARASSSLNAVLNQKNQYIPTNSAEYFLFVGIINKILLPNARTIVIERHGIIKLIIDKFKADFPYERYKALKQHLDAKIGHTAQAISTFFPHPVHEPKAYAAFIRLLNKNYFPQKESLPLDSSVKAAANAIHSALMNKKYTYLRATLDNTLERIIKNTPEDHQKITKQLEKIVDTLLPENGSDVAPFILLFNKDKKNSEQLDSNDNKQAMQNKIIKQFKANVASSIKAAIGAKTQAKAQYSLFAQTLNDATTESPIIQLKTVDLIKQDVSNSLLKLLPQDALTLHFFILEFNKKTARENKVTDLDTLDQIQLKTMNQVEKDAVTAAKSKYRHFKSLLNNAATQLKSMQDTKPKIAYQIKHSVESNLLKLLPKNAITKHYFMSELNKKVAPENQITDKDTSNQIKSKIMNQFEKEVKENKSSSSSSSSSSTSSPPRSPRH